MKQILNIDCLEGMRNLIVQGKNGTFDFIEIDPPYNIGKDKWDKFESPELYMKFIEEVILLTVELMSENGSLFIWHNDIFIINEYINIIKEKMHLKIKQLCIWNKYYREDELGVVNKQFGFLNGFIQSDKNRNYQKMCEYVLYCTKQDELDTDYGPNDPFREIKEYFFEAKDKAGLNISQLNNKLGHRQAEHTFYKKKQWQLPTLEVYRELQGILDLSKPYDELSRWYNDLRYTYNAEKNNYRSSVWNYPLSTETKHKTEKPLQLYYDMFEVHTREDSKCLFPFVGSGNNIVSLMRLNEEDGGSREFIGFETDALWYEGVLKRIGV